MANTLVECTCLPQPESVSGNVVEIRFLLFFDELFEGADGLGAGDFDLEDAL